MRHDFRRPLDRLIYARCLVMDQEPAVGDFLCGYVFHQDVLDRVARVSRQGKKIMFNPAWAKSAPMDELVACVAGVGRRAMPVQPV